MEITPSILVSDISTFWQQIGRLLPYLQHFQVDICDGIFVLNKTITIDDIFSTIKHYNDNVSNLIFDFHLMVKNYKQHIEELNQLQKTIKIDTVLLHYSVNPDFNVLSVPFPFSFGLVLDPDDRVETIKQKYDLQKLPAIQIMSVYPGQQGQAFLPETLQKIEQLRKAGYRNKIYLDGGINEQTLPIIFAQQYKPDVIGPGSFFSKAEDIKEKIDLLNKYLRQK